ncbi:MAG: hypothetical protein LIO53_02475 [Oscillospiraceae bacterium]|nr:hypothetical protein [Oscillospiraceae bacterium]
MFDGEENETVKIYGRLIRERLNNVYYKRLYDWCGAHGVALMGHPKDSGDIDEESFFHIPGQDLVFRWVSPENGGTVGVHSVQAKCSSDAARHSGKRRNMNECFGVCSRENIPWYFTADDMKWYIDWLGVRGVNMFVPHAFYYSLTGKRKDERPPDVGPNNIWWRHYKLFSDYIKRVSYIMTDSENCAKTAVLCESGAVPYESVRELYERQIEFNYLPYSLLNSACAENGRLKIAGYEYKYIIGETTLPIKSIKSADEIDERDFHTSIPEKDLRVSHLIKHGVHMYFIVNEGENDVGVKADMPLSGTPVAMDLWSGKYYKMPSVFKDSRTYIDLSLKWRESLLVLFDTDGDNEYPMMPEQTLIDGLDFKLIEENSADITKTYAARYQKQAGARNEYLRVKFDEMAECYINGTFCGASFFNRGFRIGEYLTDGINEIRLVITGNIANKYSNKKISYGLNLPDDFVGA